MPTIAFLSNTSEFLESHRRELLAACVDLGWSAHAIAPAGARPFAMPGVRFHPIALDRHGTSAARDLRSALQIAAILRDIRADIAHCFTVKAIVSGNIAARLARVPVVVNSVTGLGLASSDAGGKGLRALVMKGAIQTLRLLPRASFVCQNAADASQLRALLGSHASDTLIVRGSGVNLARFTPSEPVLRAEPVVLFASRLLAMKGLAVLVRATEALRARGVRFRLRVAGALDPSHPQALTPEEVHGWAARGLIEYVGAVDDVARELRDADVAALPSLGGEGVPKFLLEAIACGVPFVTTRVPGCADLAEESRAGLAVPAGEVPPLADALEGLLTGEHGAQERARLRAAALAFRDEVAVERIVGAQVAVYRRRLADAPPSRRAVR